MYESNFLRSGNYGTNFDMIPNMYGRWSYLHMCVPVVIALVDRALQVYMPETARLSQRET